MPANVLLAPISSFRIDRSLPFSRTRQRSRHETLICAVARPSKATPAGRPTSSNGNVVVVGGGWAGMCLYLQLSAYLAQVRDFQAIIGLANVQALVLPSISQRLATM